MDLYIQLGWGMMAHTAELLKAWSGGGVVLSPRDLEPGQLADTAASSVALGGEVLLDPQCYLRDADHERLSSHAYYDAFSKATTGALTGGAAMAPFLSALASLNVSLGVKRHILPGLLVDTASEAWFTFQERVIEEAANHFKGQPILATVAVSTALAGDSAQIEALVDRARDWGVQGFYVVAEAPSYLVGEPVWLGNVLALASGLKLHGKPVIVGYTSHQMLCLASANVDIICSGNFANVRAFSTKKFYEPDEKEVKQKTTWYYCPQALTEYKIPFLDVAKTRGVLANMKPDPALGSSYAAALFGTTKPSAVGWSEPYAFRHYLCCVRGQARQARKNTFDDTLKAHNALLDSGEALNKSLKAKGVFAQERDFQPCFDVNRSALIALENDRGARLRRTW